MRKVLLIYPEFCVGVCISLFILPISWVAAWLLAAAVHEIGHLLMLKLLKIPVLEIRIRFRGASIITGYITPASEFLCAMAGPLAGLCCLMLSDRFPLFAICAFLQSVYNLLPYPDYDGGRMLLSVLQMLMPADRADNVYRCFLHIISIFLLLAGVYLWFVMDLGIVVFLFALIPVMNCGIIKIPCKRREQIVQ